MSRFLLLVLLFCTPSIVYAHHAECVQLVIGSIFGDDKSTFSSRNRAWKNKYFPNGFSDGYRVREIYQAKLVSEPNLYKDSEFISMALVKLMFDYEYGESENVDKIYNNVVRIDPAMVWAGNSVYGEGAIINATFLKRSKLLDFFLKHSPPDAFQKAKLDKFQSCIKKIEEYEREYMEQFEEQTESDE